MKIIKKINHRLKFPRIIVQENQQVVLELSPQCSKSKRYALNILKKNQIWIDSEIQKIQRARPLGQIKEYNFENGMGLFINGCSFRLLIDESIRFPYLRDRFLCVGPNEIRKQIKNILFPLAKSLICQQIKYFKKNMGLKINNVTIKEFKSKLGSCDKNGNLSFDWRIFMFSSKLIDYIVVHELSHINNFNHKEEFWQDLLKILPDAKDRHQELKKIKTIVFNF